MNKKTSLSIIGFHKKILFLISVLLIFLISPAMKNAEAPIRLIILDPGHGHATFMQGRMYPGIDPIVHVYAPEGQDVQNYLNSIKGMNSRSSNPTSWKIIVYTGNDYLEKMVEEKKGNAVVISGNNKKKGLYMKAAIDAGMNVLADKPMAITPQDFELLKETFETAEKNKLLIFDSMDLRYSIEDILMRELADNSELFGKLKKGSTTDPALVQSNLHHFLKMYGGKASARPAWFFDIEQQGHGITDVSTHLVDLTQWLAFPDRVLNYKKDVKIISSLEWPTLINPSEFKLITRVDYPDYLQKDIKDSTLSVYANGEINYTLKGIHSRVTVVWKYVAKDGLGDTHYALMRGTKASLEVRQGADEKYQSTLFIKPAPGIDALSFAKTLNKAQAKLVKKYSGLELNRQGDEWAVKPGDYNSPNAAEVAVSYLLKKEMPNWEAPNILAKYYTTTSSLKDISR